MKTKLLVINSCGQGTTGNGITAEIASNCFGGSTSGIGLSVTGTATNCRGQRVSGTAISAGIAVACTASSGTISFARKHLGTP
jgi:hypothetical protein